MYFLIKKRKNPVFKAATIWSSFSAGHVGNIFSFFKSSVPLVILDKEPETAHYPEFTENKRTFHSSLPVSCSRLLVTQRERFTLFSGSSACNEQKTCNFTKDSRSYKDTVKFIYTVVQNLKFVSEDFTTGEHYGHM